MLNRLVPSLILLAWSAWLASAYLLSGTASYMRQHDTAEVNTPYYTALPRLAARGLAGFRDPLAGTGVDALANLKGDMPLLEAFFRVAPHWSNSGVLILCQTLVAAAGMFLLMRRQFGSGRTAALTAALWFSFLPSTNVAYSGFPTWYGWYVPGLPFVLLALGSPARGRGVHLFVAAVTGAVLGLGTPTASGILVLPVVAGWLLLFTNLGWGRAAAVAGWFSTAFLIVKAPTLVALVNSVPESHRMIRTGLPFGVTDIASQWAGRLADARDVLTAQVVPLAVAAGGWALGGFRRRPLTLALAVILLMTGATIATPLLQSGQGSLGSVYRSYQMDRINRFLPFFAAVACALSLDHLHRVFEAGTTKRRLATLFPAGVTVGLIVTVVGLSIVMNTKREALRKAGSTYAAFFEQPPLQALARAHVATDPFRIATFADRNSYDGQHPAFAWAHALETADVYGTTYALRYHAFWQRVIDPARRRRADIRDYFDRWGNRAYLFNPAAVLFGPLPADVDTSLTPVPFNLALLSLANVRYLVSRVPLEDENLRVSDASTNLIVYRNTTALPRFFIVHDWLGYATRDALLDALSEGGAAGLRATAMLDEADARALGPPPEGVAPSADTAVSVTRYEADRIELTVNVAAPGLLIASNSYDRFWTVTLDGTPSVIVPAYHAFQGVPVPQGEHRVVLAYAPPHSWGGAAQPALIGLAIVSLAGLGIIAGGRYGYA